MSTLEEREAELKTLEDEWQKMLAHEHEHSIKDLVSIANMWDSMVAVREKIEQAEREAKG